MNSERKVNGQMMNGGKKFLGTPPLKVLKNKFHSAQRGGDATVELFLKFLYAIGGTLRKGGSDG